MTLEEAISHSESKIDSTPCGQEHKQLAAWLKSLRQFVKGAYVQKVALETGCWGHAGFCNFQRTDISHCNCGLADIQEGLRKFENKS